MSTSSDPTIRDRVVELVRVRAGDLVPNAKNWRRHPQRQRDALRGLLQEIGYSDALLARREGDELVLIDGHLRQSLDPDQTVPVLVLDVDESEADKLLATLDPLAALATPDSEALEQLLGGVTTSSDAVLDLLERIRSEAGLDPPPLLVDPDEIPEAPEAVTEPGDLWLLGQHRLLCADATKPADLARVLDGERAQLLWTDPPYGVDYTGKTPEELRIQGDHAGSLERLLTDAFAAIDSVLEPGSALYVCHPAGAGSIVFLQAFCAQGWRLHQTLVWAKDSLVLGHSDYHFRHEPIAYGYALGGGRRGRGGQGWHGGNAEDSVFEVARPAASREHPTAKPVELIRRCLHNSSAAGQHVLDPFAGSGSVLIACELMQRRAYALEIDPRYCDVIVRRWERCTGKAAQLVRGGGAA
ncbi:MAG: DNA modification methylase [Actinomycetota bacterium]